MADKRLYVKINGLGEWLEVTNISTVDSDGGRREILPESIEYISTPAEIIP